MKKIVCLLLALMMLVTIVACGDNSGNDTTKASGETTKAPDGTEEPEVDLSDNLPEKTFNRDFRILKGDFANSLNSIVCDEPAGDQMNQAVFDANATVKERFGVNLVQTYFPNSKVVDNLSTFINAQEDAYDIVVGYDIGQGNAVRQGYLIDLRTLEYNDYSKPWWPSYAVESMTVNDRMYLGSNSISYWPLINTRVIFMNKDEADKLGIEVPYQDALDGKWYLDDMIKMTSEVYSDDGNGIRDMNDFYGFVQNNAFYCVLASNGINAMEEDEENILVWNLNNEKTVNLIETFNAWLVEGEGGYLENQANSENMFATGHALMTHQKLTLAINTLYSGEMEYAILPYPKYDMNQETYICDGNDTPFSVPVTNGDREFTSIIIEAMSAEGYKRVRPIVFESALKYKYSRDHESMLVMDIIDQHRNLDLAYIFGGNDATSYSRVLGKLLGANPPSTDFASFYATGEAAENTRLAEVIAAFTQ